MDPAESDNRPRKRRVQEHAKPKLTPALYKASVTACADAGANRASSSAAGIDDAILQRIKKCLQRANHKNTPEPEAKAAFYLASRLMSQYNVSQAEVLAHEPPAAQQQYAGQSVVSIKRADGSINTVNNQAFVSDLALAMQIFFDCKTYSTRGITSMDWTFYGIAENTMAAAMAFEMAYNLISEWARPYRGVASKNSYCIGVAEELRHMAQKEKRAQEKQALEAEHESLHTQVQLEKAQRRAELDRLAFLPSSLNEMAENDDDEVASGDDAAADFEESEVQVDLQADLDVEIKRLFKSEPEDTPSIGRVSSPPVSDNTALPNQDAASGTPRTIKQEEIKKSDCETLSAPQITPAHNDQDATSKPPSTIKQEEDLPSAVKQEEDGNPVSEPLWTSSMQLTTFRANASRIADDYIKDQGLKLSSSKSSSARISDYTAYLQGTRDSKKIDVRRTRIEA